MNTNPADNLLMHLFRVYVSQVSSFLSKTIEFAERLETFFQLLRCRLNQGISICQSPHPCEN